MKLNRYCLIVPTIFIIFAGIHSYTNASQANNPSSQVYQLVLPNGQSMEFARNLLKFAESFAPALERDEKTIPIALHITQKETTDPEDVSLQDLHTILTIISHHPLAPSLALTKFLFANKQVAIKRMIKLLHIAMYLDIKPLQKFMINGLSRELATNPNDVLKFEISSLPEDWQKEITPEAIMKKSSLAHLLDQPLTEGRTPTLSVAWSPDGSKLAVGLYEGTVKIWNTMTWSVLHTLRLGIEDNLLAGLNPNKQVLGVAWSADSQRIAAISNTTLKIWDLPALTEHTLEGHREAILAIDWSPDATKLVSGSVDGTMKIWDTATYQEIQTITAHALPVTTVAWSPNNIYIASGSIDRSIKLWSPTGAHVRTLQGHTADVNALAWSSSAEKLASGSTDQTIKIWNPTTGTILTSLLDTDKVTSVAWKHDDKLLADGSEGGTVNIWDIATGSKMYSINVGGMEQPFIVFSVAFSPNGKEIALASQVATVTNIDPEILQLTVQQMDLIERMTMTKKMVTGKGEAEVYESLPAWWKTKLAQLAAPSCSICGKKTDIQCSVCKKTFYCSKECQKIGWKSHKQSCVKVENKEK